MNFFIFAHIPAFETAVKNAPSGQTNCSFTVNKETPSATILLQKSMLLSYSVPFFFFDWSLALKLHFRHTVVSEITTS